MQICYTNIYLAVPYQLFPSFLPLRPILAWQSKHRLYRQQSILRRRLIIDKLVYDKQESPGGSSDDHTLTISDNLRMKITNTDDAILSWFGATGGKYTPTQKVEGE